MSENEVKKPEAAQERPAVVYGIILNRQAANSVVDGEKQWVMKLADVDFRGPVAIIERGTNKIIGIATLCDVKKPQTPRQMLFNQEKHRLDPAALKRAANRKANTPWVMSDPIRLPEPLEIKDTRKKSGPLVILPEDLARTLCEKIAKRNSKAPRSATAKSGPKR